MGFNITCGYRTHRDSEPFQGYPEAAPDYERHKHTNADDRIGTGTR